MITDAAAVSLLLKSLSYGVPAAILVFSILALKIFLKYSKDKADKDRKEHMVKWDSMLSMQKDAVDAQKEATLAIVQSHKEETDRMFKAQERQAQTLEALAHNLSVITSKIEQKTVCPLPKDHL